MKTSVSIFIQFTYSSVQETYRYKQFVSFWYFHVGSFDFSFYWLISKCFYLKILLLQKDEAILTKWYIFITNVDSCIKMGSIMVCFVRPKKWTLMPLDNTEVQTVRTQIYTLGTRGVFVLSRYTLNFCAIIMNIKHSTWKS